MARQKLTQRISELVEVLDGVGEVPAGWVSQARCSGLPADWFYPERGEPIDDQRKFCQVCPVMGWCLAAAVARNESQGIWGGTSGSERRCIRSALIARTRNRRIEAA